MKIKNLLIAKTMRYNWLLRNGFTSRDFYVAYLVTLRGVAKRYLNEREKWYFK